MKKLVIIILIISFFSINIHTQQQIHRYLPTVDLPHSEKLQQILERLQIDSLEVLSEDDKEQIWTGKTTCLAVPAYFKVFWDVQSNLSNLTIRIKPLESFVFSPAQIHPELSGFDSSLEIHQPLIEISTSDMVVTITGEMNLHGQLASVLSFTGIKKFVSSIKLPINITDINQMNFTLSSILDKTIMDVVTLDKLSVKFFAEDFVPKTAFAIDTTYNLPDCAPIHGELSSGISTEAELAFIGSLTGSLNAPFGIPFQLNEIGASLNCLIAEGIIPTGCGVSGKITLTRDNEQRQRTLMLGGIFNIASPNFALKGGASYLCATDIYNLFPTVVGQVPGIISNINHLLDTYPTLIKKFENSVKKEATDINRYIDRIEEISEDIIEHFNPANGFSSVDLLSNERQVLETHLSHLLDTTHNHIERFHEEAMALRKQVVHLTGLDIASEKLNQLAESFEKVKLPDFFCLNDVFMIIAPRTISIGKITFEQGFHIKGELSMAGLHNKPKSNRSILEYAMMPLNDYAQAIQYLYGRNHRALVDLSLTKKGLKGKGSISPLNLAFGGITLFKVTHNLDSTKGPEISINITEDEQEFTVNGSINLLNQLETSAEIFFDLEQATMDISGYLFNIYMDLNCSASLKNLDDWVVEGKIHRGLEDPFKQAVLSRMPYHGKALTDFFKLKEAYFRIALVDLATGVLPELSITVEILGKEKTFALPKFDLQKLTVSLEPLVEKIAREVQEG